MAYTYKYGFHYSYIVPYIVTHNHPYISSYKPGLLISTAATYVGMDMCDNVYRVLAVVESILVCVLCFPLPSLHLFDFYEIFFIAYFH